VKRRKKIPRRLRRWLGGVEDVKLVIAKLSKKVAPK